MSQFQNIYSDISILKPWRIRNVYLHNNEHGAAHSSNRSDGDNNCDARLVDEVTVVVCPAVRGGSLARVVVVVAMVRINGHLVQLDVDQL